jgi:hypothetical protein
MSMRYAPPEFLTRLQHEFAGRFRVRWSPIRHRWQVEEKVDSGSVDVPLVDDRDHDDWHRTRDGYVLYAEISPGTTTPCPSIVDHLGTVCGADMKAEPYALKQVPCPSCGQKTVTGFFPLGEALLEQLRFTDPNRGGYERNHPRLIRARNERMKELRIKAAYREAAAVGRDDARLDIAKRGYTGREGMWLNAPAPRYTKTSDE